MNVIYARDDAVAVKEFSHLLVDSGHGRIRPIGDPQRLRALYEKAGMERLDSAFWYRRSC